MVNFTHFVGLRRVGSVCLPLNNHLRTKFHRINSTLKISDALPHKCSWCFNRCQHWAFCSKVGNSNHYTSAPDKSINILLLLNIQPVVTKVAYILQPKQHMQYFLSQHLDSGKVATSLPRMKPSTCDRNESIVSSRSSLSDRGSIPFNLSSHSSLTRDTCKQCSIKVALNDQTTAVLVFLASSALHRQRKTLNIFSRKIIAQCSCNK